MVEFRCSINTWGASFYTRTSTVRKRMIPKNNHEEDRDERGMLNLKNHSLAAGVLVT